MSQNISKGTVLFDLTKTRFLRILFLVLTILWMITIFYFSSKTAVSSTEQSIGLGERLFRILIPDMDSWPPEQKAAFLESADHFIRKTAHFTEYLILGVLLFCTVNIGGRRASRRGLWKACLLPFVAAFCYAVSDEIHQSFVPGRSGQAADVLIDSCGAFAGILIFLLVFSARWDRTKSN